ncbi:MAG: poly-beta-1,6-N-acetyl-D-glucosamine biosynthesis protein PgaD [Burkholderiaceae bacterium]
MNKIINTRCSRLNLVIDASLTAFGWVGLVYLMAQGVTTIANTIHVSPDHSLLTAVTPILQTVLIYITVAAFNALLLVLWARHRKLRRNKSHRPRAFLTLSDDTVALHFSLSRNALHEVQDSRVTIIHLSDIGGITRLETDQLHAEAAANSGEPLKEGLVA